MSVKPSDVPDILSEREQSQRVLDRYGGLRRRYDEWKEDITKLDRIYGNEWEAVWPDLKVTIGEPKVPNLVQLAVEHRSRQVASVFPSIMCPAEGIEDDLRKAAEKRERVLASYHHQSRTRLNVPMWAMDAQMAGVTLCKVLADDSLPRGKRYPTYQRIDPRFAFPSPAFTRGPFVDDLVVAYEENARVVAARYDQPALLGFLSGKASRGYVNPDRVRVIEYYDEDIILVVASTIAKGQNAPKPDGFVLVGPVKHRLSHTPIAIGVRPSGDGTYRNDFEALLPILLAWHEFMTMELDSAKLNIYPERVIDPSEIDTEKSIYGPDGSIIKSGNKPIGEVYAYVQRPGAPFAVFQDMRLLEGFARSAALLPLSVTGDPNESIISAAGISATQSMPNEHVRSIQQYVIGPMLEAANELAFEVDERWCDAEKEMYGVTNGQAFRETYKPTEDIAGNYRNRVEYGPFAGVDPVNQNVMVLHQWNGGNGIIPRRRAMELSPYVENPIEAEKQIVRERLLEAELAGLISSAALPPDHPQRMTAEQIAKIDAALEDNEKTLREAILENTGQMPLAPPPGPMGLEGNPASPGIAGAAEPVQEQQMPPALQDFMVGPPTRR